MGDGCLDWVSRIHWARCPDEARASASVHCGNSMQRALASHFLETEILWQSSTHLEVESDARPGMQD